MKAIRQHFTASQTFPVAQSSACSPAAASTYESDCAARLFAKLPVSHLISARYLSLYPARTDSPKRNRKISGMLTGILEHLTSNKSLFNAT